MNALQLLLNSTVKKLGMHSSYMFSSILCVLCLYIDLCIYPFKGFGANIAAYKILKLYLNLQIKQISVHNKLHLVTVNK